MNGSQSTQEEVAIRGENLSKKYRLYESPQHRLKEALNPFRKRYHRDFWALKDVTLDIPKGKTVGIIGQNGSGKSTLLQIICGILQPTTGSVHVNGRISTLLELGTGFNKEYTGRDNVFMQGAIMGLRRTEITDRFGQIAEFADIGAFIEQPVKTYSSGMYVRLAFAVAINVDPDILVVDEALAVGDIRFQRKCYAKFDQFRTEGRTILFVSHSLETINQFCDTALLLQKGEIIERGVPKHITRIYQRMMLGEDRKKVTDPKHDTNLIAARREKEDMEKMKLLASEKLRNSDRSRKAEIIDYGILDAEGNKVTLLRSGETYTLFCRVLMHEPLTRLHIGFPITTKKGLFLFGINNEEQKMDIRPQDRGDILDARVEISLFLAPGNYFLSYKAGIWAGDWEELYDEVSDLHFIVFADNRISQGALVNLNAKFTVSNI